MTNVFTSYNYSQKYPALLYGLAAFLGFSAAIFGVLPLLLPIALLVTLCTTNRVCWVLFFAFFLCTDKEALYPTLGGKDRSGTFHFHIQQVGKKRSSFGEKWMYRGKIYSIDSKRCKVPCQVILPTKESRPNASCDYLVKGKLREVAPRNYRLLVSKKTEWLPLEKTYSLAELRYRLKTALSQWIKKRMQHSDSGHFLAGIATGDFDDPALTQEFSRFGLQHIMAISGFHFSIIATILGVILSALFPRRAATLFLMFVLSTYFLLLGLTPSVLRAWVMIALALGTTFAKRGVVPLNSLGVALLAVMVLDPTMSLRLGFLYSFGITAGILLFTTPIEAQLTRLFPPRTLESALKMSTIDQMGYIALVTLRKALALTLAVHLIALPLTLYFFHRFPVMSVLYNLFFPFAVSLSMLLLLFPFLHSLNDLYTHYLLSLTYNMPITLDYIWRIEEMPSSLLISYVSLLFFMGFMLQGKKPVFLHNFNKSLI